MPCKKLPHTHDILKSERGATAGPWLPVGLWWLRQWGRVGEVTLPSWTQQGQKERGLRRGVPPLGSTSKGPNKEEENREKTREEEGKEERNLEVERDRERVK